jgi:hypothetical protein
MKLTCCIKQLCLCKRQSDAAIKNSKPKLKLAAASAKPAAKEQLKKLRMRKDLLKREMPVAAKAEARKAEKDPQQPQKIRPKNVRRSSERYGKV